MYKIIQVIDSRGFCSSPDTNITDNWAKGNETECLETVKNDILDMLKDEKDEYVLFTINELNVEKNAVEDTFDEILYSDNNDGLFKDLDQNKEKFQELINVSREESREWLIRKIVDNLTFKSDQIIVEAEHSDCYNTVVRIIYQIFPATVD